MSIIKWLMLLPIKLAAMLAAVLLSPLAAGLSMFRGDGLLPSWLTWTLTRDNSIDALWQQEQHLSGYPWLPQQKEAYTRGHWRWLARTLWLIRNPAGGLSYALGYESAGQPLTVRPPYRGRLPH